MSDYTLQALGKYGIADRLGGTIEKEISRY